MLGKNASIPNMIVHEKEKSQTSVSDATENSRVLRSSQSTHTVFMALTRMVQLRVRPVEATSHCGLSNSAKESTCFHFKKHFVS